MPDTPDDQKWAAVNENFKKLSNSLNPFQYSDGSNNRLLIGKDSAGNPVMKVSKAGFDAYNAADSNLIFNSGQDVFKIIQTGTTSSFNQTSSSPLTLTVSHGLGYQPIVVAYAVISVFGSSAITTQVPYIAFGTNSTVGSTAYVITGAITLNVTSSTLSFAIYNPGALNPGLSGSINYYILQETSN